ncbi:NAD(P)/FAD-dependent oxidoreductase [Rhodocyclus purpureus]|uniref:NAD(P)/FAD-dependent oxidoreductase n=1 Tax=Rhodocyclus purpureus TaxID=1067 RepID=UPI00191393A3|nr:NAD(P)/FAD-dependent oxidoreductase [Rhodocyclus purpureus]MBK5913930.1 FAD-dependent oxidoreductase [Rhodocyclus purpureus]
MNQTSTNSAHRVVIVGGGAGGLELATRLGEKLGRSGKAQITLIDRSRTHIWKPTLHEIAAGSMDPAEHEVAYLAHGRWHGFRYRIGEMIGIDRKIKEIRLAAYVDDEGREVTAERSLPYDTLVIAVGCQCNDFGTPGVKNHAIKLETPKDARRFNVSLINACVRAHAQKTPLRPEQMHVAIIGAGATGVELAAELHHTIRELLSYGLDRVSADRDLKLYLIEAGPRVLPALPERLSNATEALLKDLGVDVMTGAKVTEVRENGVLLADGTLLPAELIVWAAGVKAAEFLTRLDGLETNRINQLLVRQTLQTTLDDDVFAIGDCSCCPWPEKDSFVPPRAQAAHQQASHLYTQIQRRIEGKPLQDFRYVDYGSMVSLGKFSTVGSMMGGLTKGSLFLEGAFAKMIYISLYKKHELALHSWVKVVLDTIGRFLNRRTGPHVKLH